MGVADAVAVGLGFFAVGSLETGCHNPCGSYPRAPVGGIVAVAEVVAVADVERPDTVSVVVERSVDGVE